MRITTLVENTRLPERTDLVTEHALSLHIDRNGGGCGVLFDTGDRGAFADNAHVLGVDLGPVGQVDISHHHYDHGGGLRRLAQLNSTAPVYLRPGLEKQRTFRVAGVTVKRVGLDPALPLLLGERLKPVTQETEIAPGVFILVDIPRTHPLPRGNRSLFEQHEGGLQPDAFDHELVMAMRDEHGLVVFTGCSHRGILNMLDAVCKRFPGEPIRAVLGGFHLISVPYLNTMSMPPEAVRELGQALLAYPVERYFTGHCTGAKGYAVLKEVMKDRLDTMSTGKVLMV